MLKHKITTKCVGIEPVNRVYRSLIKHAALMTLNKESADLPCVINVLITDDAGIRVYNREHRGIDKATDVLSFPMQEFSGEGWEKLTKPDMDLDTQTLPLGDIIISIASIKRNARRFKYTFEQETTHMIIHSTLHLLGYDHGRIMETKEKAMMQDFGYLSGSHLS